MIYYPDKWVVLKLPQGYKVFASWTDSSWRINSGIVSVDLIDDQYHFYGHTGSTYVCHKNGYGATNYGYAVLSSWIKEQASIRILDSDTDFKGIKYD